MEKIKNIFLDLPGYNCFGCSPDNSHGLKLDFYWDEDKETAVAFYKPETHLVGFPGILHGGIQATLLDEIAFWVMFGHYKKMGFTTQMQVQYKRPLSMNHKIELKGKLLEKNDRTVNIHCCLYDEDGQLCTEGTVEYVIVNKKLWMRNMGISKIPESFNDYFE